MSSIQLPSDATMQRTLKVVDTFEEEIAHRRMMMIYAALCLALFAGLSTLHSSFYSR